MEHGPFDPIPNFISQPSQDFNSQLYVFVAATQNME